MKLLKVILAFMLSLTSVSALAQKEAMMNYLGDGGQALWHSASMETLAVFQQRVALCNEDLKDFFFLKQLASKIGIGILKSTDTKGKWKVLSRESKESKEIWVMFYGFDEKDNLGVSTYFSYYPEGKVVHAPLVEISREWFCSRMLHELGHVKYHVLIKAESATAETGSTSWMGEEVATHEYERVALDYYTDGQYTKVLSEILDKYNPLTLKQLFAAVQKEDFERLDGLFGTPASTLERGIRGPAFMINLSTLLAERLKQDPISFYDEARNFILELESQK